MSDISVEEAYRVLQAACGIEVGDRVRILRVPTRWEGIICGIGYIDRSNIVGEVGTFTGINFGGGMLVRCEHDYWHYPFFCLELVEKAEKATYLPPLDVSFEKDGLTVGGTFISKETIRRNLDLENDNVS